MEKITQIEELFYKTYEIKPIKKPCPHKGCRNHATHPCEICGNTRFIYQYPLITDGILLELICILCRQECNITFYQQDCKRLKEYVLTLCIRFANKEYTKEIRNLFECEAK